MGGLGVPGRRQTESQNNLKQRDISQGIVGRAMKRSECVTTNKTAATGTFNSDMRISRLSINRSNRAGSGDETPLLRLSSGRKN
jgi:hypothetical protein